MSVEINGTQVIVNGTVTMSKDWEYVLEKTGMTWEELAETLEDSYQKEMEEKILEEEREAVKIEEANRYWEERSKAARRKAEKAHVYIDGDEIPSSESKKPVSCSKSCSSGLLNLEDFPF